MLGMDPAKSKSHGSKKHEHERDVSIGGVPWAVHVLRS